MFGKYGTISTEKKQLRPNEPVFLIRATDEMALAILFHYAELSVMNGCSKEFIEDLMEHMKQINEWQKNHPNLVKKPD